MQIFPSTTDSHDDRDDVRDPRPPVEQMQRLVPQQRRREADQAHDDDADRRADMIGVDRRDALPADDSGDEREACYRRGIQE